MAPPQSLSTSQSLNLCKVTGLIACRYDRQHMAVYSNRVAARFDLLHGEQQVMRRVL